MRSPPWWKPDGLSGIAGDRDIMDSLYNIEVLSLTDEKNATTEAKKCRGWLNIVKKCLYIVGQTSGEVWGDRRPYLDYLRWNQKEIFQLFENFSWMIYLEDLHPDVQSCELALRDKDKGLIHEYERAYNIAMTLNRTKVTLHTACRFVHVIDLLCRKGITDSSTYDIVDIDRLLTQGQDLQSLLTASESINSVLQNFQEFIVQDLEAKTARDNLIMTAMSLARARSSEGHLKSRFRQIREKVQFVEEYVKRATMSAWSCFWDALTHPRETVMTVWNWIKQNPLKSLAIVAGAAFTGGVVAGLYASGRALEAIVGTETILGTLTTSIGVVYNTSSRLLSNERGIRKDENQELVPREPTEDRCDGVQSKKDEMSNKKLEQLDKVGLVQLKRETDEAGDELQSKLESLEEKCLRFEVEIQKEQARLKQKLDAREKTEKCVSNLKSLFDDSL